MKKHVLSLLVLCVAAGLVVSGCAQKPTTANSGEAIDHAKTLQSVQEQTQYLVKEANGFINSEQFDEAIKTAKYILGKLDSNSTEAQSIIEKAKAELQKLAEQKLEEAKSAVSDKLGSFGQ